MIDEDFRARYIIIRASFVSNFRFTQILLHKVLARLGIMCPEIEHWNDKKWSTIHQLRLRLSITIDFNSSPRVHINYQLKGHNHEDECNITQKKTLHTLIFHRGTTSWNNVSSCRYSCRYLVYFPKHCQLLPPVQTACLVTSADPRELRGWEEWSCRVLQNTARHLGSGILRSREHCVLTEEGGKMIQTVAILHCQCPVLIQSLL